MKRTKVVWEGGGFRKNRTSGFKWCFVYTLVWELKPDVRTFVRFGGREGVSSETNFVRFAGLLRTFAMVPKVPKVTCFFFFFFEFWWNNFIDNAQLRTYLLLLSLLLLFFAVLYFANFAILTTSDTPKSIIFWSYSKGPSVNVRICQNTGRGGGGGLTLAVF